VRRESEPAMSMSNESDCLCCVVLCCVHNGPVEKPLSDIFQRSFRLSSPSTSKGEWKTLHREPSINDWGLGPERISRLPFSVPRSCYYRSASGNRDRFGKNESRGRSLRRYEVLRRGVDQGRTPEFRDPLDCYAIAGHCRTNHAAVEGTPILPVDISRAFCLDDVFPCLAVAVRVVLGAWEHWSTGRDSGPISAHALPPRQFSPIAAMAVDGAAKTHFFRWGAFPGGHSRDLPGGRR
jgi:hypothetical protein